MTRFRLWLFHPDQWMRLRLLAARIARRPAGPVLDVGGGDGPLGAFLPEGYRLIVADRHRPSLANARKSGFAAVQADGTALPFKDGCVKVVSSCVALQYV